MEPNLYQFQKRQIALIARVTPYAMAGHIANTTVIAIALAGSVRPVPLAIWCAYSYATALFLLYRHVRNRRRWPHSFRRAAKKATIYAFLLALPWSSLAVLYLGSLSHGEELLLVALGIGMAACGTVLLSAIPSAAFSYMSVILLPSALKYLLVGQQGYLLLGTLALSYWGCLAALIAKTSRDNRERQESELVLAERNAQIALAGTAALVGSYGYDVHDGKMQVSEGYAAIHGLPEGTTETTRREWRDRVHPDDVGRLDGLRCHAFQERGHEYNVEYRIVLPDRGVRWIESRSFISYDGDGNAQRVIGINIDITERKRTELALQASEAKFAGILAIAGDAIVSIDANDRITLFNRAAERVFGYSQAEVLGQSINSLIPTQFRTAHQCHIEHFASGSDITRPVGERQELMGLRKDGEEFQAEASISKLDIGGERYYTVVMRDITDRKRAELALAERNTQLELASKTARIGSFSVDFSTGVVKLTSGCATIYGLPEGTAEMSCTVGRELVHPEDLPQFELRRDQAFLAQQREFIAQFRIVRADDRKVRWIEARNLVFYDQSGKPLQLIGVSIDFTERKLAEDMVAERNLQLELAGKAGLVGHFAYDPGTQIMQISQGYAAIHAFPEGTTEIARSKCLAGVHPDDIGRVEQFRSEAFREGRREYSVEYRIIRPGGEVRWVETRCFISYDHEGHPHRVIGVSIDITERKCAEEGQRVLVAELDHRVKNALATVSAVVSHTHRGSRSVDGFVDALEGRIRSMAATHELLSSRQWQGLSVMDLARRELAPYATPTNTEINGPDVTLRAEAGQALAMVLHELATNAAKYGALSAKHGRVSVRWDRRLNGQSRSYLVLDWRETGGPPVVAAGNSGYGTSTIRDLLPYEFGGTVDLVFAPEGVQCRLELPADWLSDDAEPVSGSSLAPREIAIVPADR